MVSRPQSIGLLSIGESEMAIQFAAVLPAPPPAASDWAEVASGVLIVTVPSGEVITMSTERAAQAGEERLVHDPRFVGPQDAEVPMEFYYLDDAGNRGASVYATVRLLDTIPPVAPSEIGLKSIGETPD
jgi:hypothetical protein